LQLFAFALIIGAAITHATWNAIAKASRNLVALMWWATAFGMFGYGLWLLTGPGLYLNPASWLPFLISALCETGYFITLVKGYSQGDLSLVYPVSRGSAPIFAAVMSAAIFGETLPWLGYVGIVFMVVGVYVASQPLDEKRIGFGYASILGNKAVAWALASAVFIAIYSISDKVAVAATNPLVYNWWVFLGNAVLWAPFVWRRGRVTANMDELRTNWRMALITSVLMVAAYAFALAALALTSASYVVSGRGLSVIIGAWLGSSMLKEKFGTVRIIGAALMFAGLAMMAFS
jgi:drug/metabolite transporter (DMT)-like permease